MVVGTWNLENLFRPAADADGGVVQAYVDKLSNLAGAIGDVGMDVLAVQEVGDPEALEDLRGELNGDWHSALSQFPDGRGIRVGFLSRLELSDIEDVRDFPDALKAVQVDDDGDLLAEMGRGALRVRVTEPGRDVDLVTCHLKSKLLTFPGGRFVPRDESERARFGGYALYRRASEAVTVRAYANELLDGQGQQRAVIVLGDLNDEPLAATTQILLGAPGSEIGTPGFDRPDAGDASRLWNIAPLIPEQRRFSRRFRGRSELIDHILVSHALVGAVKQAETGPAEPPSNTEDPGERRAQPATAADSRDRARGHERLSAAQRPIGSPTAEMAAGDTILTGTPMGTT